MTSPLDIAEVSIVKLDEPLNEPFAISSGSQSHTSNILVQLRLKDGSVGYGEGAPSTTFNGDSQSLTLAAASEQIPFLRGRSVSNVNALLLKLDRRMPPERGAARAALQMAILDAWARSQKIPLRIFFGGAKTRVFSDVTVTLVPSSKAGPAARKIVRLGVTTIKIKVGRDVDGDIQRVRAVAKEAPKARLIVDANQGYSVKRALDFVSRLKKTGIVPALFEQPVQREDLAGMFDVEKHGRVPVCADESAHNIGAVNRLLRREFPSAVNIKLMKYGIVDALEISKLCRKKGRRLMMGGNIETSLAMNCSAHFACGQGGFDFIDLDTPLWFFRKLWSGPSIGRHGLYDLSRVRAGLGLRPLPILESLKTLSVVPARAKK
jgi:L-alanine-DL-glutamate epimerase-like enolase superfamily enzyme